MQQTPASRDSNLGIETADRAHPESVVNADVAKNGDIWGHGISRRDVANCISSKRLQLTILPTEACNFRCTYCYEDFAIGRMPEGVVKGVKALITRRASELSELALSWFGGEPLLALPVVRNVLNHAKREALANGFTFHGGFTTNGYLLTTDLIREFEQYGHQHFQITLDGCKDEHDRTRLRADGKGTFDVIWRNLVAAHESDASFHITLRVHFSPQKYPSVTNLLDDIQHVFGNDDRFHIDLQHIRDMGGNGSKNVTVMTDLQVANLLRELRGRINEHRAAGRPGKVSDDKRVQTATYDEDTSLKPTSERSVADGATDICYASKPNHWLIRANGRIGRCTVLLNNPLNDLGYISEDGNLHLKHELVAPWFAGFAQLDPGLLSCPVSAVYAAGDRRKKSALDSIAVVARP